MGEAREGDCRVQLIFGLFFICVLGGGFFLCHFIFHKETETSSDWFYLAGITLEAVPWAFWLLTYLYMCFKHRAIQQPPPPPPPKAATAPPTSSPKSDEQLNSHFELAVVVEDEDELGQGGVDGGGNNEDQRSGDGSNRTSSSSMFNDVEFGIRESDQMPLKS